MEYFSSSTVIVPIVQTSSASFSHWPMFFHVQRTSLDNIAAGIAPWSLVEKLLESLCMGVKLLLEEVEALKAMLAGCDKLPVESFEAIQGSDFGHGELLCCAVFNASQCLRFVSAESV